MRNKKRFLGIVAILLSVIPASVFAQASSINTFSPYTFNGLGDFTTPGATYMRSMGGVGVGFRSAMLVNPLNPAGLSATGRNTFIFNLGFENQNFYSRTAESKTSFNTFNIRDVIVQFPVYKKMGISVGVTPLTNVGYRVEMIETDPNIIANLGQVRYLYAGEGGIAQFKLGYGLEISKGFSLGAELIYYRGSIDRSYGTEIFPVIAGGNFGDVTGIQRERYSRLGTSVGIQYNIIDKDHRLLTFGATFQPKTNLRPDYEHLVVSSSLFGDTIVNNSGSKDFHLPMMFTTGLFYQTTKVGVGMDYTFQNWTGINTDQQRDGVVFKNNHFVKAGVQYTPNRYDVRSYMKRWTYRAGMRYNNYYMVVNDNTIHDYAVTLGVGIPIRAQGLSCVNVGAEFGTRGSTRTGVFDGRQFQMVKENYFKVSIGLSLFGEDYWFVRHKYN